MLIMTKRKWKKEMKAYAAYWLITIESESLYILLYSNSEKDELGKNVIQLQYSNVQSENIGDSMFQLCEISNLGRWSSRT